MEGLGFSLRNEAVLQTLTEDVLKSNEIEGEKLDRDQARSSIARRLGLDVGDLVVVDRHVEGVVEMMLDATGHYADPLDIPDIFIHFIAVNRGYCIRLDLRKEREIESLYGRYREMSRHGTFCRIHSGTARRSFSGGNHG